MEKRKVEGGLVERVVGGNSGTRRKRGRGCSWRFMTGVKQ